MAEFCLPCLNKLDKLSLKEKDVKLSKELDLCEGCGEWKRVVEKIKNPRINGGKKEEFYLL
jgi:flavoprotein